MINADRTIRLKGADGAEVTIDLSKVTLTDSEREALDRLCEAGDVSRLSEDDRALLSGKKALVSPGAGMEALIARFDIKFVRID